MAQITCPVCQLQYDDTYRNTICPHDSFEMHTGVTVGGERGCAHTIDELNAAHRSVDPVLPNPDCAMNVMVKSFEADRAMPE
jgi:hypothetical protein